MAKPKKVGKAEGQVTLVSRESFYDENGELKIKEIYSDKSESIRGL